MSFNKLTSVALALIFGLSLLGSVAQAITLNEYLNQVQAKGLDAKQFDEEFRAAGLEERESDLYFKPAVFLNAERLRDRQLPNPPFFVYDEFESDKYSLGLSEEFNFGLQSKLYYQLTHTNYVNSPMATQPGALDYYDARPVLELTMPFWQNGFGRRSRAQKELLRAQSEASAYGSSAQTIDLTIQAETAYWRLAAAKQAMEVQAQALKSAQDVKDYVSRKARMNLGEDSDVVQANALVEARNLQLQQAQNDARAAAQDFNGLRFENSSVVPEAMDAIVADVVATLPLPGARPGNRVDVLATEAQSRVAAANSKINAERNRPVLDVYGSYAFNGRDDTANGATDNITKAGRPSTVVGLRFSMPLDLSAQSDAIQGAHLREQAAQTSYQRAVFNQDKDWADLVRRIGETETNLKLATSVESIQMRKLALEKTRLRQGRTTTYQVLLFEQDLLDAQLSRVRNAAQVLSLRSQIKAYEVVAANSSANSNSKSAGDRP